ncbi:MAG: hypothetical protein J6S13_08105 [Clostridia bacterium]|nr:hypothetical protein [Clostridia bacterium]
MDYKLISEAAKRYKDISKVCDMIDKKKLFVRSDGSKRALKDLFRIDTAKFMMFLSASDGSLSRTEVELLDAVTGCNTDAKTLAVLIKEFKLNSVQFAVKILPIVKIAVECDKAVQENGLLKEIKFSEALVGFFKVFGKAVISLDGVTKKEDKGFDIYIGNLENFVEKSI